MTPRFAVCESMTPSLSFAEDLDLCRRIGADGIAVFEFKLSADDADLALLDASGLEVSSAFPASGSILHGPYSGGGHDPDARIEEIVASVRRLARFRPDCVCVTTGPPGERGDAAAREIAVDGLRRIAAAAAELDMTIALEIMHPSLHDLFSFVTDIPAAVEMVERTGAANIGIAVDAWHVGDAPEALAALRDHAPRFTGFHVDDWREPTRSWADRVLPGDGTLDLVAMLRSLEAGGFDGWYELEVVSDDGSIDTAFDDSLWAWDPYDLAGAGRRKFMALWERASTHA